MKSLRRILCMTLALTVLMTVFMGVSITGVSAAPSVGAVIEAESGILSAPMQVYDNALARGGKAIGATTGARLDDPAALAAPEAHYTIDVPTAGNYKIYFRLLAVNTGCDSFWYRFDSSAYIMGSPTAADGWQWYNSGEIALSAGLHTLDIARREVGMYVDLVVLSNDLTAANKAAIESSIGKTVTSAGMVVEAEAGALSSPMLAYDSPTARGSKAIGTVSGARLDDPSALAAPEARYYFDVPATGTYKVYFRLYAADAGCDSFWYRFDSNAYIQGNPTAANGWRWFNTAAVTLSAGTHTFDFCRREIGMYYDFLVLATDLSDAEKTNIESSIGSVVSTAPTFNTVDGSVMFEAEAGALNSAVYTTLSDASASGGSVINAAKSQNSPTPSTSEVGMEFNFIPDRSAKYDIWVRYSATSGGSDSMYYSFNGAEYLYKGVTITTSNPSEYSWTKLDSTALLNIGAKYNVKLHSRETGMRIDKVIITSYPFYTPTGIVTSLKDMSSTYALPNTYPTPSITPPAAHPRLYLKSSDIATIKSNMQKAQDANALTAYNNYLAQNIDGSLKTLIVTKSNYSSSIMATIEAYALKYVLDGDATYGNKAIAAVKNMLRTVILEETVQDVTRPMGHVINLASEVYDWCYPLLTTEDKDAIIASCETIAKGMEVGYPPSGQGAVSGHGGELQLFRDLLSFGIATYNERPDIYNFVAGRLLSQYIEPRNYWYDSNTYHQGDSYGEFRYSCDMLFQWTMYRMSGVKVFSPQAEFVPYQWIYNRRPDGQLFRNGDNYQETSNALGVYWNNDINADFYSANFYGNKNVKQQYIALNPNFDKFDLNNGVLTPVKFLLFNNPDLAGESHTASFPLTKYFGSPNGTMVARTGWTEPGTVNQASNVAMAQMVISEQWAANHQHLDAGSFQFYYKGALASDSGLYDAYNTNHDKNYNKETIASNSLLIYDPSETMFGGAVNSGGQRRPGNEVNTFSQWMSSGYDTGKVLDQAYDTASAVPTYSYIKGDITRAYASAKASEVVRSMMFMPITDGSHPAAMIVMDKVTSTNPSFAKTWLLHSQQEPAISGNTATIKRDTNGYNGRLDLTTLLPTNAALTKVGGAGNEFNINGTNYAATSMYTNTSAEPGAWRIEAKPGTANTTDYFLNVMQVSDASANKTPLAATLIETSTVAGAKIYDRVAIFGKAKDRMTGAIEFTVPGSETGGLKMTVAGVVEGKWNIYKNSVLVGTATATKDGGILYFEGGAGAYTISMPTTGNVSGLQYRSSLAGSPVVNSNLSAYTGNVAVAARNDAGVVKADIATCDYRKAGMEYRFYGDRDPSAAGGNGSSTSQVIYSAMGMLYTSSTSAKFLSPDVTKILTLNDTKNIGESIPNMYTFDIDKSATVYMATPVNSTYAVSQGWVKDTTGLKIARGNVTTVLNAADSKYYAIPTGEATLANIYSKHYNAGDAVAIPSPGATTSTGSVVIVVWD